MFGEFSIADFMYAPVVVRFFSYNAEVSDLSQDYMSTLLAHPQAENWLGQARSEAETIDDDEAGHKESG